MSRWMYAGLYFKNHEAVFQQLAADALTLRPRGTYRELLLFAGKMIGAVSPQLINRYYYFFEPQPHFFMVMELKNKVTLRRVEGRIARIRRPAFVERIQFDRVGKIGDPEPALDFFHAGTKFALLRAQASFQSVYQDEDIAKLVHCFCNQQLVTRSNELDFYTGRLKK